MEKELRLMKGNEAVAEAAIRAGADGYFGYPITPQSEILEYLMEASPYETTGMVVLQAESEVAAINMVYGGAACGKKVYDNLFLSRDKPDAGGNNIYCGCRTALPYRKCCQRRTRTGNYSARSVRLFSGNQGRRSWRLSSYCSGSCICAGNG